MKSIHSERSCFPRRSHSSRLVLPSMRNGATQCKLLKGVGTKVVLRECPDCVADDAEFLEEQISDGINSLK